jgi:hypothetical protein
LAVWVPELELAVGFIQKVIEWPVLEAGEYLDD